MSKEQMPEISSVPGVDEGDSAARLAPGSKIPLGGVFPGGDPTRVPGSPLNPASSIISAHAAKTPEATSGHSSTASDPTDVTPQITSGDVPLEREN